MIKKKKSKAKKISLYRNLVNNRKSKQDKKMRQRAEYLASLPKHPVKRFFYRLHPKRVLRWLFSKQGFFFFVKAGLVTLALGIIFMAGVFLYFRQDVKNISPDEVSKKIKTTVNRYYDRHGTLLWEDMGDGDYTLTVKDGDVNDYVKFATVAIEDRDFFKHHGISLPGIMRAAINNLKGGSTQGGSTLTQQLIKQAYFSDVAHERGIKGIPRKIKEMILAIELERSYTKDQIITMYLNESPYGGRRNGIESGAQTYFGKSTKDLTLAEAALLASIPNQPGLYNPYNIAGNKALIKRQHKVLDDMVEIGKITSKQAEEAKKIAILDTIKPEVNQWKNIKAPHFVLEAKKQVEKKFGIKMVRAGGLSITTTLDLEAQNIAEQATKTAYNLGQTLRLGADNIALASIDVKTGQIIAMVGSVDFNKPGYGQRNAAISELEPGSSIKPVVDFAPLFMERPGLNYGPGSILKDEDIRKIYCVGAGPGCNVQNYTRRTYGDITIRNSLGGSLNRPAIKAMHIVGIDEAIKTVRKLGDKSYCQSANYAGLSSAIGGGCTVKLVEHANTFASLARGGGYQDLAYILNVKNSDGDSLITWQEKKPERVIDPQSAYMVTDILADPKARLVTFGGQAYSFGFTVPNVWTASKTGTTENGQGKAKDSWMMSYSPVVATGVWSGNHNGAPLARDSNDVVRRAINDYMSGVHLQVYSKNGKWKKGDKITQPTGIKKMTFMGKTDIWPSWFDTKKFKKEKLVFDKISKKKATDCTPELAKEEIEAYKYQDPYSKKDVYSLPSDYNYEEEDDVHDCDDIAPSIKSIQINKNYDNNYSIKISAEQGTHPLDKINIYVNDKKIYSDVFKEGLNIQHDFTINDTIIKVDIEDELLYNAVDTISGPSLSNTETSYNESETTN